MNDFDKKEKELLQRLKEASKPQNHFTLTLQINDIILEKRVFSADKYSLKTLSETRTHFLMTDLMREIQKAFSEQEDKTQEETKKAQMDKLWKDNEQGKTNNNDKKL